MIPTVELTITQLTNDLYTGLTWLAKDDNGAGSIQAKYDATEMQIHVIKQHPSLKDVEIPRVIFAIRDDTKEEKKQKVPVEIETHQNYPLEGSILRSAEGIFEPEIKEVKVEEGLTKTYI